MRGKVTNYPSTKNGKSGKKITATLPEKKDGCC